MPNRNRSTKELLEDIARLSERVKRLELENRRLRIVEVELATSEKRLQSILDNTTAVIYLKDLEGHYFTINRQYEKLFHVTRHEILGKTDYEIFATAVAEVLRANDQQVVEAEAAIEFEEVVPHDDGLHTYISVKFPLRDTAGTIYAVCGISTDITDRKRSEHELREALARLSGEEQMPRLEEEA